MANPAGSFIWYELMTMDPEAIAPFYSAVVGWTVGSPEPNQGGGMDYRMIGRSDGGSAGGVLRLTADMQEQGAKPLWIAYFSTPNVDRPIPAIVSEGGPVQVAPTDIPKVCRIALVTDPERG